MSFAAREEIRLASRDLGDGLRQTELTVPGIRCAGCIGKIEKGLLESAEVRQARVNLSTKRVRVAWSGDSTPDLIQALDRLGFTAHLTEPEAERKDPELTRLIRALAVAGFTSMNIMLLSVSVWSGADAQTRHAFHAISAVLALPCLIYSGQIFFRSAWSALRRGRTNMDVPISVGVLLAFAMSVYDTLHNGPHAYFDAVTSLIFFLLIGRTLDHLVREKARTAVSGLARMAPRGATVVAADGAREHRPIEEIEPGMRIALAAGDRVPVDGVVESGASDLDCAVVTGESAPRRVEPGATVQAGVLNLTGPLILTASARAEDSFLAEMTRLMAAAEDGRAGYRRIADRAAALYSPVVHSVAFLTFLGWMAVAGDWRQAITVAIAVLIITCPCAMGLAAPIVQVMAARRLFENGVMVKDGAGLERLARIDVVAFDKTGTLTLGRPRLVNAGSLAPEHLAIASALAQGSNHPVSRAVVAASPYPAPLLSDVREDAGLGVEGRIDGAIWRLGRADWALTADQAQDIEGTVLSCDGRLSAALIFEDALRPDAAEAIRRLRAKGLDILILSGDQTPVVEATAKALGVETFSARLLPSEKVERLNALAAEGRRVLMVGDGLNDAPALSAAHVSMAPGDAADIGRNAADFVFLNPSLNSIELALDVARETEKLVRQNFALSILYNAIALPIAILGHVTPLVAALAMSLSSIVVVGNALRLKAGRRDAVKSQMNVPARRASTTKAVA